MENIFLKPGDKFLYRSKYGKPYPVCEVLSIDHEYTFIDNYKVVVPVVTSTKNVRYHYDECLKIIEVLSPEEHKKREQFLENVHKLKTNKYINPLK